MSSVSELQESFKKLNLQQMQQQLAAMKADIFNKFSDVTNVLQDIKNIEEIPNSFCRQPAAQEAAQNAHPLMYSTTPETDKSNVVFMPAQKAEDTKVLVGDVEVSSVVRAKLDYNPELGFPVLHLEIVNPTIIHNF